MYERLIKKKKKHVIARIPGRFMIIKRKNHPYGGGTTAISYVVRRYYFNLHSCVSIPLGCGRYTVPIFYIIHLIAVALFSARGISSQVDPFYNNIIHISTSKEGGFDECEGASCRLNSSPSDSKVVFVCVP